MEQDSDRQFEGTFEVPPALGSADAEPLARLGEGSDQKVDSLAELCAAFGLIFDEGAPLSRQGYALMACTLLAQDHGAHRAILKQPSNSNALLLVFDEAGAAAFYDK